MVDFLGNITKKSWQRVRHIRKYWILLCQALLRTMSIFFSFLRADKERCKGTAYFLAISFQGDLNWLAIQVVQNGTVDRRGPSTPFLMCRVIAIPSKCSKTTCPTLWTMPFPSTVLLGHSAHCQSLMLTSTPI